MGKAEIKRLESFTRPAFAALALKFNCENEYMNAFIRSNQAWDRGYGSTYIFLNEKADALIGFYNISTGTLDVVENGIHHKQGGTIHINQFAVDKSYKAQAFDIAEDGTKIYWSDIMLDNCIALAEKLREKYIGFACITLYSTKEGEWLYQRNDFQVLEEDMSISRLDSENKCKPMYLPLDEEDV